ncbi:unnamed protein product [Allacma fusca]|uniref:Phospholipid scramblase n=1 Tax=Allacma fusca TaxID=39272 RepID=A0A8J2JFM5_9HEXA|nr:unnamed protein product [Allacma fusca]
MHDMTQVFLKQEVEIFDAIFGCNTKNKYKVKNSQGKIVYVLKEETNCCTRNCCGSLGAFDLSIVDSEEREVIQLSRPPTCNTCPCWLQVLEVQSPPGTRVGSVVQEWNMCHPQFRVMDATGEIKFRIKGSGCPLFMCGSVEFQILDGSNVVGKVSKKWSGLLREGFTEADNFGLSFPPEVDVRMKAVLLGALFLLHRMYFDE